MGGLVYGEKGEKNIADIADNIIGGRDQSCLNQFITRPKWDIEVFYRDVKQHLGMGEYQTRKLDAVVIHLHLVFLAYSLLKMPGTVHYFKKSLRVFDG